MYLPRPGQRPEMVVDSPSSVHVALTVSAARCDGAVCMKWPAFCGLIAAAVLLASPCALAGRQLAPWFGTWQLNPAKSAGRTTPSPYKRVTITIEPLSDGLKVIYDMVGTRGGVTHMEWIGRFDSRDYPVQGVDYVLTNAYRRINDRSYEIAVKMDGRLAATAVAVVSPDGRTLTVTTNERTASGTSVITTAVYDRR